MLSRFLILVPCLLSLVVAAPFKTRSSNDGRSDHRVVSYNAYYRQDDDPSKPTDLYPIINQDSRISHLILFVSDLHLPESGEPPITIGGPAPDNTTFLGPLWEEVAAIQARGISVLASFGGAFAESYLYLEDDFDRWYPVLADFLKEYNLDGLDLDIEPGPNGEVVNGPSSIVKLIKTLKQDMKPGFLITMAPVALDLTANPAGFSGFDYKELDGLAVDGDGNKLIDWMNAQFYNGWGSPTSTQTYDNIIAAGWEPERVVMGVIAAKNEGNGWAAIETLKSTVSQLAAKYPSFGGVGKSSKMPVSTGLRADHPQMATIGNELATMTDSSIGSGIRP